MAHATQFSVTAELPFLVHIFLGTLS